MRSPLLLCLVAADPVQTAILAVAQWMIQPSSREGVQHPSASMQGRNASFLHRGPFSAEMLAGVTVPSPSPPLPPPPRYGFAGLEDTPAWIDYLLAILISISLASTIAEASYFLKESAGCEDDKERCEDDKERCEDDKEQAWSSPQPQEAERSAEAVVVDTQLLPPFSEAEPMRKPRRWYILALATLSVMGGESYLGMPMTFFAGELDRRGAPVSLNSIYISILAIGALCSLPLASKLLGSFAPNRLNRISLALHCGIASAQGLLHLASEGAPFATLALTLRTLEGLPVALTEVCAQTMVMRSFNMDELPTAFSVFLAARQLAPMIGEPAGGVLYNAGGFGFPYAVGGCVLFTVYLVILSTLSREASMTATPSSHGVMYLLSHWRVTALAIHYGVLWMLRIVVFSNIQVWLGEAPYSKTPSEITVLNAVAVPAFMLGTLLVNVLSSKVTIFWTLLVFGLLNAFTALLIGHKPPVFPSYPATYGAAVAAFTVYFMTNGAMTILQPIATHLLTSHYSLDRQAVDAPVGVIFFLTCTVGVSLGGLAFGPMIDAVGVGKTVTTLAGVSVLSTAVLQWAILPIRHATRMES